MILDVMIQVVIVDDEPLARSIIKEYLEDYAEITIVAECSNGREAIEQINALAPDLVFLDIQMPGLTGFEVLEQLEWLPKIVFSTASESFALHAFDSGAIDYLLKPYNRARFRQAVERVLEKHEAPVSRQAVEHLLEYIKKPDQPLHRLFVKKAEKIIPVAVDSILWIEAAGDYSTLHTAETSHLCSLGLGALHERLDEARFVRVHRSTIIAFSAIQHIVSDGEGGYLATLVNEKRVRISRTYAPQVRDYIV